MNRLRGPFKSIKNVLFWAIISAAFIGPGTVTTAATAGFEFGLELLWVLVFATFACIVLQEAVARLTIASGLSLGQAIAQRFRSRGWSVVIAGSIIFGCAAYEAGNLMGAVAGMQLIQQVNSRYVLLIIVAISAVLLWKGKIELIVRMLGLVVALMGILFIWLAFTVNISLPEISAGLIPRIPTGGSLLVIGLLGTTIVPYNLFLGSGISEGQSIQEMRRGLPAAIILGGVISMAILIASSAIPGEMSFENMHAGLSANSGPFFGHLFALGLFAAGATSALTAPLAAAITGRSFAESTGVGPEGSTRFNMIWAGVLGFGFSIGFSGLRPIPVIISAQAVNGLLLPFLAVIVMMLVNDPRILPTNRNGLWGNVFLSVIIFISSLIGFTNVLNAAEATFQIEIPDHIWEIAGSMVVTVIAWFMIWSRSIKRHESDPDKHD